MQDNASQYEQTPQPETAQSYIKELGLKMETTFIPGDISAEWRCITWDCRIFSPDRPLASETFRYHQGLGHFPWKTKPHGAPNTVFRRELENQLIMRGKIGSQKAAPPAVEGVLCCLVADADVLNHRDFEEWARDLGYDSDSRKAEATYNKCLAEGLRLKTLIPDLSAAADAFQDF